MSDPGYAAPPPPPPPPYPPAPQSSGSSDIPLWIILGSVLLAVLGTGAVGFALLHQPKSAEHALTFPKTWDPRIAPYVKIVERRRGHPFLHPVAVRFLSDKEFTKTVTGDDKDLDKKDREELTQATGLLRALGLISGDVDLFKESNNLSGSGILAYYSFDSKNITVRGQTITASMKATIVHELTHVIQDQYFDVGDRLKKLDKASTTESDVLHAIVEGDADRIEETYRASLPASQRKAIDQARAAEKEQADPGLKGVPKILITMFSSPYTLGDDLAAAVATQGGNSAMDDLIRDAPAHDSALLDPLRALTHATGAHDVPTPALAAGEKKFDSGEFGALTLYFVLAERLPLRDALAAADTWDGDSYVAFTRAGTSCARIAVASDSVGDSDKLLRALRRWRAALPGGPAKVSPDGSLVLFESCDPGKGAAHLGKDSSIQALQLLDTRGQLGTVLLKQGAPAGAARCLAAKLVQSFPMATLQATKLDAADAARAQQLGLSCRGAR